MAQELLRFTSGKKIQPTALVSQDRSFQAIQAFSKDISDTAKQVSRSLAKQVATEQGALAGEDPTFHAIPNFNEAAAAFNSAGLQSNRYTTAARVNNEMGNLLQIAQEDVSDESVLNYSAEVQGFTKGLLEGVPAENHAYIKNLIDRHANQGFNKLNGLLQQRGKTFLAGQFDDSFRSIENEMSNAARKGDMVGAASFHSQLQNMLKDGVDHGLLSEGQFRSFNQQSNKVLNRENAVGQFIQNLDQGRGNEFIKEFRQSKQADQQFSAVEKDALIKRMQTMQKEKGLKSGVLQDSFLNTLKTQISRERGGVHTSPDEIATIQAAFPKRASEVVSALDLAHLYHENVQDAQTSTNGQIRQEISELNSDLTIDELKSPHPQQIIAHRLALSNEMTSLLKERQSDPFNAIQNSHVYREEVEKQQQGLQADPENAALSIQKSWGVPDDQRRLITKAAASEFQSDVLSLPFVEGVKKLEDLKLQSGQNWKYIKGFVLTKDFPSKYSLMMGVVSNPNSRPYKDQLVAGLSVPEKEYKNVSKSVSADIDSTIDSLMIPFTSSIQSYPVNTITVLNGIKSNIRRQALWYTQNSNYNLSAKEATQRAFTLLVQNRYSEINNNSYRVPFDVSPENVRKMVNVKNRQIEFLWDSGKIKPFRDVSGIENETLKEREMELDKQDILINGTWVTNGANENQLIYMSSANVRVTLLDGSFLTIDLRNLNFFDEDLNRFKDQTSNLKQKDLQDRLLRRSLETKF